MSLALRKIANSMTTAVNENVLATLKVSNGYSISADGTQIPSYVTQTKTIQTQAMDVADLDHLGFGDQQGQFISAYADGMIPAIRRGLQLGTTIVSLIPYGETTPVDWKVMKVLESYNDWVKVLLCRQ